MASLFTIAIALLSLISVSSAQMVMERRRSLASRIIAGVVVGVICFLAIIFFCLALIRRRRARNNIPMAPLFSTPWGGYNQAPPPQHAAGPAPAYGYDWQQDHTMYPPQNAWAPPAYKGNQSFSPPPGPPPPAHTTDQNKYYPDSFKA